MDMSLDVQRTLNVSSDCLRATMALYRLRLLVGVEFSLSTFTER